MSYGILCDSCKVLIPEGELKLVAVDATIKTEKPEQLHICQQCYDKIVIFIGQMNVDGCNAEVGKDGRVGE